MSIYLDHNATTPVAPEALEAMLPYFGDRFGNPSSPHRAGREAGRAIARARAQVAALVGVQPGQVVFTSGGTEANNLALRGAPGDGPLVVGATEHPSVLEPARVLAREGRRLHVVGVDRAGRIDPGAVVRILGGERSAAGRALVSVMLANNETGVVQDVAGIAASARAVGAICHTDAAQAAGRIPVDFDALGVQLMTLSSQKVYGPKGVGALIVDRRLDLEPILHGGGHEGGRRAGTENVPAIVGFGVAAELAVERLAARRRRLLVLREALEARLRAMAGIVLFAEDVERLPNTICLAVPGIDGEMLAMALSERGLDVSSGSACSSQGREPSHVLLAMGVDPSLAVCALRVSLGDANTPEDVDRLVDALEAEIARLRPPGRAVGT